MPNPLKQLLHAVVPMRYHPWTYLTNLIKERSQGKIIAGPFTGLAYGEQTAIGIFYPKILGTYEAELIPTVAEIVGSGVRTIINVGAGEGYYACGLAMALPQSKVIAFEADLKARYLLDRTIALNHQEGQVTPRGLCDIPALNEELAAAIFPALVICDIEGHEYDVLHPERVEKLRDCSLLVELHDFLLPGITEVIKGRFSATHRIVEILTTERSREDFLFWNHDPLIKNLPMRYIDKLLSELRPGPMNWLWMTPRSSSPAT